MLTEEAQGGLIAICDDCEATSLVLMESREIAILRLLRARWRVRTAEGVTHTRCPTCQTAPSVPAIKVAT